jgi:hypothetical protein
MILYIPIGIDNRLIQFRLYEVVLSCKFLYRLIFTISYIPIGIDDLYTISYLPIGIDLWFVRFCVYQLVLMNVLYDLVYMKSYYPILHTQYSPLSTLSCCRHSHDSDRASKDSDPDDDDYDDDLTSKEDYGDGDDGDDDGDEQNGDEDVSNGSFAGENEQVVLNVNYEQERLTVNFSGLTSHLAYCYDPPLCPFSECYCIVLVMESVNTILLIQIRIYKFTCTILYMLRLSEQMTIGTPFVTPRINAWSLAHITSPLVWRRCSLRQTTAAMCLPGSPSCPVSSCRTTTREGIFQGSLTHS